MHVLGGLGRRVQLVSMDAHCANITIGLYQRVDEVGAAEYRIHSYSRADKAPARLDFLAEAMAKVGGMERTPGPHAKVRWPCGEKHTAASKRLFLEVCKLSEPSQLEPRPSALTDPKLPGEVRVAPRGEGRYEILADGVSGAETRLKTICAGYLKLAEMEPWTERETGVRFSCGFAHDGLMNLLLFRALNARAAMREMEMMMSRGVLLAPSAQAQAT